MSTPFTAQAGEVLYRGIRIPPVYQRTLLDLFAGRCLIARISTGQADADAATLAAERIAARIQAGQQRRGRPN